MYHPNQNNPSYLTQPIIPSSSSSHSPTRNQLSPGTQSNSAKQHAFGSDSDHESDSDEESAGFQVYKDNPSNSRYSHLPVTGRASNSSQNPLNRNQNHPSSNRNNPALISNSNYNYPPHDQLQPSISKPINHTAPNPTQELVPMPALGSEWNKNESRKDKDWEGKDNFIDKDKWNLRKEKILTRKSHADDQFRDFLAGRRNLGGWFNRFMALGILIFFLILGALLSFFLVPRIPTLAFDNQTPLIGDSTNGLSFDVQEPVKFNFNGKINLAMTATSYVKPKLSQLRVTIDDLSSTNFAALVATGSLNNHLTIDTKEFTAFSVDLKFSYSASSKTDPVWGSWHEACKHKWPGAAERPNLQLGVIVEFVIIGRLGTFSERTIFSNVTCPVELPTSAP